MILSRYMTCSTGASKPVISMLFTITMPMSPLTPSSSPSKGSLKLLIARLVLGLVRVGLQMQLVVVAAGDDDIASSVA